MYEAGWDVYIQHRVKNRETKKWQEIGLKGDKEKEMAVNETCKPPKKIVKSESHHKLTGEIEVK